MGISSCKFRASDWAYKLWSTNKDTRYDSDVWCCTFSFCSFSFHLKWEVPSPTMFKEIFKGVGHLGVMWMERSKTFGLMNSRYCSFVFSKYRIVIVYCGNFFFFFLLHVVLVSYFLCWHMVSNWNERIGYYHMLVLLVSLVWWSLMWNACGKYLCLILKPAISFYLPLFVAACILNL